MSGLPFAARRSLACPLPTLDPAAQTLPPELAICAPEALQRGRAEVSTRAPLGRTSSTDESRLARLPPDHLTVSDMPEGLPALVVPKPCSNPRLLIATAPVAAASTATTTAVQIRYLPTFPSPLECDSRATDRSKPVYRTGRGEIAACGLRGAILRGCDRRRGSSSQ